MNRLVTIEELSEGDEIVVSSGSTLKYFKLLKTPVLGIKQGWKRSVNAEGYFTWDRSALLYKSTLCSTCVEEKTFCVYEKWHL